MEIRRACNTDIEQVVNIHLSAFEGFFLTHMGSKFLGEYYRTVLLYEKNITFVCVNDEEILGFVTGFYEPKAFYSLLRKRKIHFILPTIISILKNPFLVKRLLYNVNKVNRLIVKDNEIELSSIAVHKKMQGNNIGKLLVKKFIDESRRLCADTIYLTTDAKDNETVNRFYLANGFTNREQFLSQKRLMNIYTYNTREQ